MNLWLRLLKTLAFTLFRRRLDFLEESVLTFRVWPCDLDPNIHMNNARYLSIMDLGRADLLVRTGLMRRMLAMKWQAVLGGSTIRYRKPLKPFQRFRLHTRLLCWDEKWFFLEHRIETAKGVAAIALVKGIFVGAQGPVPATDVVRMIGFAGNPPETPAWVQSWRQLDGAVDAAIA